MAAKLILKCNGKKLQITPVNDGIKEEDNQVDLTVSAPGQGEIEISTPQLSAETVTNGKPVSCKAKVNGKNIAFISYEVMLQLGGKLIGPLNRDYLHTTAEHDLKGVLHPHWITTNEVEFEVLPKLKLLYCGEGFTLACLIPEQYGALPETQIWSLEGVYQRGGGEPFRARLEFDSQGALIRKTGFYPASVNGVVAPFELFIEDGDTFEPFVTMISSNMEEMLGSVNPIMLGGGNQLHWAEADGPAGKYFVGIVVQDFDGHLFRKFSPLIVTHN